MVIAWPDEQGRAPTAYAISIPYLGSLIGSMSLSSKEVGLTNWPVDDRPPVLIPFFGVPNVMVGLRAR